MTARRTLAAISAVIAIALAPLPARAGAMLGGFVPHHLLAIDMIESFYREVSRGGARRVWLLSPDHFKQARGWAALCASDWDGVRVDAAATEALRRTGCVDAVMSLSRFKREHGLAVHIPLIARYFEGASVVPVMIRADMPDLALLAIKRAILREWRDGDILIVSMDMSHYLPPEGLRANDDISIPVLTSMRVGETSRIDVDAKRGAALALMIFRETGAERGTLLERSDSSEITGETIESGTSYATIVYRAAN